MTKQNVMAVIPARGGSKGIPRKNLVMVCGKPLIAWSIESAQGAHGVDRVVVSTDDAEIEAVSRQWGADVVRRPAELSGDASASEAALLHVLDCFGRKNRRDPKAVVFLQATSPCRISADIDEALEVFRKEKADSLFSACAEHFVGRWRRCGKGMKAENYDPRHRPRRQEYPREFLENGSIYIFKPSVLRKTGSRLGGRVAVYEMPAWKSFQIDEFDDLNMAEWLMLRLGRDDDRKLAAIKLLVFDFDGVMTDNRVMVDEHGTESVWCSRADGLGIQRLKTAGIKLAVLSTEKNRVVAARCRKLVIPCLQGLPDKLKALRKLAGEEGLSSGEIGYVGNDVNDLGCLRWVGVPMAVADAVPEVRAAAAVVLTRRGGQDAVRELADRMITTLSR